VSQIVLWSMYDNFITSKTTAGWYRRTYLVAYVYLLPFTSDSKFVL